MFTLVRGPCHHVFYLKTNTVEFSNTYSVFMENLLGLLKIHVQRGVNLAIRDVVSSDPYVVIKMGKQVNSLHLV